MVLIKFRLRGIARFLSHSETMRLFTRACARAGLEVEYSKGFNPRPRLSLPLPRSVGVESDDEMLCLRLQPPCNDAEVDFRADLETIKNALAAELPEGFELISISEKKDSAPLQPKIAEYTLKINPNPANEQNLKNTAKRLLAAKTLPITRRINEQGNTRNIDAGTFIKSINFNANDIIVQCNITTKGSIRVDEILTLLNLKQQQLAQPVRRTRIIWQ